VSSAADLDNYRLLNVAALMALFGVGMYAAAFGPTLPFLADDLGISLDTAGLVVTALFTGSITASALVAIALHGRDTRRLSILGLIAATTGITTLALAPNWPIALLGGVILGTGDGLVVAALHILMGMAARDVPSAMNRLNLYFAFGAIAGPIWAGGVLTAFGERWIVFTGIAAFEAMALLVMLLATSPQRQPAAASGEPSFRLPGNAASWTMGAVLFLYVGAEFGLGTWVSSYARQTAHAGVLASAFLAAGYWAALAAGRMVSGAYFSRGREPSRLLILSIAGAGISSLVLAIASGNIVVSAAAAGAAGLCLGPIWPTTLAIASEGGGADVTATTVTIGNAGGMAIPWLQGRVLVNAGPRQGVAVTAALCGMMFCVVAAFRSRRGRTR
jgi:fucose permease